MIEIAFKILVVILGISIFAPFIYLFWWLSRVKIVKSRKEEQLDEIISLLKKRGGIRNDNIN